MTETTTAARTTKPRRASTPRRNPASAVWQAFRRFRKTRPFWGSLILAAGGYFVLKPVMGSNLALLVHLGTSGAQVYVLGIGMIACAAVCLLAPSQRYFPAVMAMVFSVASLPLANLGGWIVGMVLGIVGSGLVFAWTPYTDRQLARFDAKAARKKARKDARRAARQQAAAA
ncbi:MAG: DUF6114 domain-containing protein [Nocardioides sp.]|uniref:DUF6114 domain-containing protein n=1 Tax=Nocardioides sp. TaxID=35761 RepID=UPI0039E6559E